MKNVYPCFAQLSQVRLWSQRIAALANERSACRLGENQVIDFYYNGGPNPMKVALLLEELATPYRIIPIDMFLGEQFTAEYKALNPNGKMPTIVDGVTTVFDSNAILLYLAEKHGRFLAESADRGALLSWLMFAASGLGPYSGQAVHFRHYAPQPNEYAQTRYSYEARRHFDVLDAHLADREWIVGSDYSIADMAVWGWARNMDHILGPEARPGLTNIARLIDTIESRPAARSATSFPAKYAFKKDFDEEARRNMFRHLTAQQ
jgi:GSH-dependent disulfide-bond oxidoreductase